MKKSSSHEAAAALDLLEESVHLLRSTSPVALFQYYLGTTPFVLGVLFFWSDMSRSGLAARHLLPGALGLAGAFVWMKCWQAVFARRITNELAGDETTPLETSDTWRFIGSQAFVHSTALFVLPVAAILLLPLHWVFSFYQNATALGTRHPAAGALARQSWKQAMRAPVQGHVLLLTLFLFGLFVFLNVALTMLSIPFLLKTLLGVETNITLSLQSSVNTTFLAAALGVTCLCIDPLIKTAFILRCFYGASRQSGEDLRIVLRRLRAAAATVAASLILLGALSPASAAAAETPPAASTPSAPARAADLNRSIDDVLQRPEYTWRAPRPQKVEELKADRTQWLREKLRAFREWLDQLFKSSNRTRARTPGAFSFSAHGLIYILIAVVLAVIVCLAWLLWRSRHQSTLDSAEATPAAPVPDLEREDVTGEELPEDGWTRLALELLDRGELRLAMRAFYLSSLAHLATRQLISIARFKSNRDYERELRRRSHALPELTETFSNTVSVFDRVWYGMHEINRELIHHFRGNVERIKSC